MNKRFDDFVFFLGIIMIAVNIFGAFLAVQVNLSPLSHLIWAVLFFAITAMRETLRPRK